MKLKFNIFSSAFSKNKKSKVDLTGMTNTYYEGVSKRYNLLALVALVLALAVVLIGFVVNKSMFTYQNLFYMFKDIELAGRQGQRSDKTLIYPDGEEKQFALYKNGLAVGGNNFLCLFTPSGKQSMTDNFAMQNVKLEGSDSYTMVYESGGYNFSLYNSFAKLYSDRADHPIRLAEVSNSGVYAIVSGSDTHVSSVRVYDRNFQFKSEYDVENRVSAISLSSDGRKIAVASVSVKDGEYVSVIEVYEIGKNAPSVTKSFEGAFLLDCSFSGNGNFALIFNNGARVLSKDGRMLSSFDFEGRTPYRFDILEGECAFVFCDDSINGKYSAVFMDASGDVSQEISLTLKLEQIEIGKGCVYALGRDKIVRIDTSTEKTSEMVRNCTGKYLLACGEGGFLLCSSLQADYFDF